MPVEQLVIPKSAARVTVKATANDGDFQSPAFEKAKFTRTHRLYSVTFGDDKRLGGSKHDRANASKENLKTRNVFYSAMVLRYGDAAATKGLIAAGIQTENLPGSMWSAGKPEFRPISSYQMKKAVKVAEKELRTNPKALARKDHVEERSRAVHKAELEAFLADATDKTLPFNSFAEIAWSTEDRSTLIRQLKEDIKAEEAQGNIVTKDWCKNRSRDLAAKLSNDKREAFPKAYPDVEKFAAALSNPSSDVDRSRPFFDMQAHVKAFGEGAEYQQKLIEALTQLDMASNLLSGELRNSEALELHDRISRSHDGLNSKAKTHNGEFLGDKLEKHLRYVTDTLAEKYPTCKGRPNSPTKPLYLAPTLTSDGPNSSVKIETSAPSKAQAPEASGQPDILSDHMSSVEDARPSASKPESPGITVQPAIPAPLMSEHDEQALFDSLETASLVKPAVTREQVRAAYAEIIMRDGRFKNRQPDPEETEKLYRAAHNKVQEALLGAVLDMPGAVVKALDNADKLADLWTRLQSNGVDLDLQRLSGLIRSFDKTINDLSAEKLNGPEALRLQAAVLDNLERARLEAESKFPVDPQPKDPGQQGAANFSDQLSMADARRLMRAAQPGASTADLTSVIPAYRERLQRSVDSAANGVSKREREALFQAALRDHEIARVVKAEGDPTFQQTILSAERILSRLTPQVVRGMNPDQAQKAQDVLLELAVELDKLQQNTREARKLGGELKGQLETLLSDIGEVHFSASKNPVEAK